MPQFPTSERPKATSGKAARTSENQPKLQGADIKSHLQLETTEAPELDPSSGQPIGPVSQYELQHTGVIDLEDENEHQQQRMTDHPTPNHPTGRTGI